MAGKAKKGEGGNEGRLLYTSAKEGLKIATPRGQDAPLSTDVPREACQGAASKKAPKAPKDIQPTKQGLKRATPLKIDAPLLTDVPREPCQGVASKKAPKAPKIAMSLKMAMPPGQDAPLSADISREQGQGSVLKKVPKAPKVPKGLKIATPLKIAMPEGQDAPLLADVPREQGQGVTLKKAPKVPKEEKQGLKMAMPALQDAPLSSDVPREPCQDASSKKAPAPKALMEAQPSKYVGEMPGFIYMIVLEGSSPLKVQKSGQTKKLSAGTAGFKPPKTQVNKRKTKANVKEKEGTEVPEQQNVKRLKRMKEVEVREAIEQKLVVDEVKVEGHTGKGQLEKVPEVKIALKRDGEKNKAKKHVEKGQEDKGPVDKALALVGSSKRPKLQVKRAKQSRASCTTSTTMTPYVEVINEGKLVRICRNEPPCASRNTLMEK
ncbi:hypothetical protein L7F22_003703 [Adiantum nelumboides]|nr:hypothetical protein [Adiantum nelumboides]